MPKDALGHGSNARGGGGAMKTFPIPSKPFRENPVADPTHPKSQPVPTHDAMTARDTFRAAAKHGADSDQVRQSIRALAKQELDKLRARG